MKSFNILIPGNFVVGDHLDVSLEAVAQFIDESSLKKNKLKVNIIERKDDMIGLIRKLKHFGIHKYCKVIAAQESLKIESAYSTSDVILLPQLNCKISILKEALSMRIIPICRNFENAADYLDERCAILISDKTKESIRNSFANALKILKEDEEVVEMLKEGAIKKYQAAFCWGGLDKLKRQTSAA